MRHAHICQCQLLWVCQPATPCSAHAARLDGLHRGTRPPQGAPRAFPLRRSKAACECYNRMRSRALTKQCSWASRCWRVPVGRGSERLPLRAAAQQGAAAARHLKPRELAVPRLVGVLGAKGCPGQHSHLKSLATAASSSATRASSSPVYFLVCRRYSSTPGHQRDSEVVPMGAADSWHRQQLAVCRLGGGCASNPRHGRCPTCSSSRWCPSATSPRSW